MAKTKLLGWCFLNGQVLKTESLTKGLTEACELWTICFVQIGNDGSWLVFTFSLQSYEIQ